MKIVKRTTTRYFDEDDKQQEYQFPPIEDSVIRETLPGGGYKLKYLTQDADPQSPDVWDDDALFLVYYHSDFWIERKGISKDDLIEWIRGEVPDDERADHCLNKYHILLVSAYIHSGVSLHLGTAAHPFDADRWDTSICGCVLAAKKEFPEQADAEKVAIELIETWNEYLSGDVYGCVVETFDKEGKSVGMDSCWGFCGYKHALDSLKSDEF